MSATKTDLFIIHTMRYDRFIVSTLRLWFLAAHWTGSENELKGYFSYFCGLLPTAAANPTTN